MFPSRFRRFRPSFGAFWTSPARFLLITVLAALAALGFGVFAQSPVQAALICQNDTAGANDEPGQKT